VVIFFNGRPSTISSANINYFFKLFKFLNGFALIV
jgi:hypothetical protein